MKKHNYFILMTFSLFLSCESDVKAPSVTSPEVSKKIETSNTQHEKNSSVDSEKQNPSIKTTDKTTTTKLDGCTYQNFQGLANIKSIIPAPEDGENCPNAMLVEFEFQLINKREESSYRYTLFKDESQFLTISNGLNPSADWLSRVGLHKESIVRCTRRELIDGDCGKVLFQFPELDTNPKEKCI